jgi:hypothetical protein
MYTYIYIYILMIQSFFGTKPTELEMEERKKKREAAVSSRLQAIATFEQEIETLAEKQTAELAKLVGVGGCGWVWV